jgi:hypothetical protein
MSKQTITGRCFMTVAGLQWPWGCVVCQERGCCWLLDALLHSSMSCRLHPWARFIRLLLHHPPRVAAIIVLGAWHVTETGS